MLFAARRGEESFFRGWGEGESTFGAEAGGLNVQLLAEGFEGLCICEQGTVVMVMVVPYQARKAQTSL